MTTETGTIVELTDSNYESFLRDHEKPVLVDYWAAWCGPCRMLSPILEQVAGEHAGKVTVVKLNVDENPRAAYKEGVRSIPTVKVFHKGREIAQSIGVQPKPYWDDLVAKLAA